MIIDKAHIERFRGFRDVRFSLGEQITLIAGQNGTQKSTLLGILSQTFTIPSKEHLFSDEVPLTGGSFRSAFQDKFRLSPNLDISGEHEWTLYFKDRDLHPDLNENGAFTIESIPRKLKGQDSIRFWQKGKRDAGSGYIQLPVIYLSLKRLIPIAEAGRIKSKNTELSVEENIWFSEYYNKILISADDIASVDYLESTNKNTLGVTTDHYDWHSNSAGQDNLSKILLAIISFKRLKKKYPENYSGGILAIDEIDATLYPGSQIKLFELLSKLCKEASVQLIATTHSLQLLEKLSILKKERGRDKHFNTVYLKKLDGFVTVEESPDYERILSNLNVSLGIIVKPKKISVYTEDPECIHFTKALLGRKFPNLEFSDIKLGCDNYVQLAQRKVPSFMFPNSIVILDGDTRAKVDKSKLKNYICLPGNLNPESMVANFLESLLDADLFWTKVHDDYSKRLCFKDFTVQEINTDRKKAKEWYNQQLQSKVWGLQGCHLYRYFLEKNPQDKLKFLDKFENIYNKTIEKNNAR
ncbi:AAA family ATPase [Vibrio sp. DW001]|uniref:AAA family ATPase n=1 Tax=Vibrio sp. DW001 TaxID=2912315 RepID=UPI0023B13F3D|nr:AAA family ATPase [Vibrio sp. DW001]WED29021.1 AAA family ATPase [Vibrio sp. DW001]